MKEFTAQRSSPCADCGHGIQIGDRAVSAGRDQFRHVTCPTGRSPAPWETDGPIVATIRDTCSRCGQRIALGHHIERDGNDYFHEDCKYPRPLPEGVVLFLEAEPSPKGSGLAAQARKHWHEYLWSDDPESVNA